MRINPSNAGFASLLKHPGNVTTDGSGGTIARIPTFPRPPEKMFTNLRDGFENAPIHNSADGTGGNSGAPASGGTSGAQGTGGAPGGGSQQSGSSLKEVVKAGLVGVAAGVANALVATACNVATEGTQTQSCGVLGGSVGSMVVQALR